MVKALFICMGALLPILSLQADTLVLQSGEELEGKLISESETEVVFEHKVSGGIIDQQGFPRSEVKEIRKVSADETAFVAIRAFKVGPQSFAPARYEQVMNGIRVFLGKYPSSSHAEEARKNLEGLRAEKERVEKGEVKWNGQWYTAEEAAKNQYQISAQRLFTRMQELGNRGDIVGALNTFNQIESDYPGSRVYPEAIDLSQKLIPRLKSQAERALTSLQLKEKQFEEGIVLVAEPKKSQVLNARKQQAAAAEAAYAGASTQKWKPYLPTFEKSLTDLRDTCSTELDRISKLPLAQIRQGLELADAAVKDVADKKLEAAEEKAKKATDLWKENEVLVHLKGDLETLKKEIQLAKQEEKEKEAEEAKKPKKKQASESKNAEEAKKDPAEGSQA